MTAKEQSASFLENIKEFKKNIVKQLEYQHSTYVL
jgi:hypothetical protein